MKEYTSDFCFTLKQATALANAWTKGKNTDNFIIKYPELWRNEYNTCVKGNPKFPNMPNSCWAVTNRFDPDVRRNK